MGFLLGQPGGHNQGQDTEARKLPARPDGQMGGVVPSSCQGCGTFSESHGPRASAPGSDVRMLTSGSVLV